MAISPILAGKFTGVETHDVSFNPTNPEFLMGYYNIKDNEDRIKHLRNLSKRMRLNVNKGQGGISKMIKDLIDDPFKYDKGEKKWQY